MCCCGCSLAVALAETSATTADGGGSLAEGAGALASQAVAQPIFGAEVARAIRSLPKRVGGWIMWPSHRTMRALASVHGSTIG
jgi:hypothetical protein